uniref:CCHC-type domain-containing protein n=1 Tax=Fagus sylvatica TaxID=28930 RepID=A0A2N9GET6_FAGSY
MEGQEEIDLLASKTKELQCSEGRIKLEVSQTSAMQSKKMLVGKLLTKKHVGKGLMKEILKRAWNTRYDFEITVLDANKFVFAFQHDLDKRKVFEGRPWTVKGHFLVLKEWHPQQTVQEIEFDSTEVWIQVHGLPLDLVSDTNVKKIGQKVGRVIEVDMASKVSMIWQKYVRVRVEIEVDKPLIAGMFAPRPDREVWIQLKYEKIPEFCYSCGKLGHVQQDCEDPVQKLTNPFGFSFQLFGKWLRTDNADFPEGVYLNGDPHYQQLRQGWNSRSVIDEAAGKETSIIIVDTKMGQIGEESRWCQASGGEPAHKRNEKSEVSAKEIIKGGDEVIGAFKNCNSGDEIFFQEQQALNEGFKWGVGEIGRNEMWKGRAQEQRIEPEIKSGMGLLEGNPNSAQQNHGTIWADLKNNSGLKRKVDEDEQGWHNLKSKGL